ncbi:maltose alpha-D-glucosyltransferase [Vineibacter terrae]|uniref:Maltokinase n=1 Tax=Vineibacter terrae TaxID=2586908 RepID=A0A5C8PMN1_9HYPH|nr:maltose alpha-D-glucosyltransferase [Vineibacter terrae]TXL75198.1 maltose alpha-D-glucosyltransferase [Vineibacter terrae]
MRAQPRPSSENAHDWYKDAVIYQLHVKSFFDSNNDGIGDFRGLIAKLDYIVELGVDTIWLLPFYPSPRRDDGYDIADYRSVHSDYGTMADVRRFIGMAHERGLRVIAELVINHTSDQHAWFQRARQAKSGSVARNYYVWSDNDQRYAGTRIIFIDTEKSNWTWDPVAGAYFWHRFYSHQPDLNFDNPHVVDEVLRVMRFWCDLGVDGLRLDAVPYLVEREGTSNENLPETHSVLKRIRAELDRHSNGRMLLAEANQWPEDAQQYFGDGDECHMAFHFPLMPRMYMAIAQEDRFPITDIMRQTPTIPTDCQWAIFLRNHDELTLEMVTDRERDYLWQAYAADQRARLNLGIRRRLAPLMEHDRRRVELMNALLLSMPGTPIIYYGDEIGMGDNIHLGDRDGVRTPMQWSPDRNGGFSRANPARLVLPTNMDPIYGFEALNVEAQSADPHSLLNWTRRMLAVRKGRRVFGRGSLRFLYPLNRKILAYLREYQDESVLCVTNLSRTAQAVELDLSAFAGRVPIDIVGGSHFPPIGQLTYLLTLPPYGVYWFLLAAEAQLPAWHIPTPEVMPEYTTLVLRKAIGELLTPPSRAILETEVLPAYLPKRRWFSAKQDRLERVQIAYALPRSIEGRGEEVMLTEMEVEHDSRRGRYLLPLGIVWEDENPGSLAQQLALARVRRGRRVGLLTDAFAMGMLPRTLLTALKSSATVPSPEGTIEFRATSLIDSIEISQEPQLRYLSVEQSNSSVIIDDLAMLKLLRSVQGGIHPESEMTRYLTEKGFANAPQLLGEIVRVAPDGTPNTLAIVQSFVRNQGDGWGWTLDFLARAIEEVAVTGDVGQGEADAFAAYTRFAEAIGRRLAEMHAILAAPSDQPDFNPEPVSQDDVTEWSDAIAESLSAALDVVRATRTWPDQQAADSASNVLARRRQLLALPKQLAPAGMGALKTRTHGDFHLGQVLVVQGDAFIIDFEGEPARPLSERRRKSSPLRDVAGMMRSFHYASAAAAPGRSATSPQTGERRATLLERFRRDASSALLRAYRAALGTAPHPWVGKRAAPHLLELFLLEKAAYEIHYEAANRPTWLALPVLGLAGLADRLLKKSPVLEDA